MSYALDVFGGARREIEGLASLVDYQQYQLEGAHLALTSNVVTAAVREAALRAQIASTNEIVAAQERQLAVVQRQFQLGAVSRSDVLAQQTQLAQTKATLPVFERDLARTRHQLAALAGRLPSEAQLPRFELAALTLPQEIPVSVPSALVHQRPDILAAEALLHQASADIGVATANLYPQITLTGSFGAQALKLGDLFAGPSLWSIGAGLLQPLFRGGALNAKRRAAIAAFDEAAANYRQTVLLAFQNVADSLHALDDDARILAAEALAEASAREAMGLAERQFNLGAISYLTLLNAQRQYHLARIALTQAQSSRYADTAALFQSLGGGWWTRPAAADGATPVTRNERRAPARARGAERRLIDRRPHERNEEETCRQADDHHADRCRRAARRHHRLQRVQGLHDGEVHGGRADAAGDGHRDEGRLSGMAIGAQRGRHAARGARRRRDLRGGGHRPHR